MTERSLSDFKRVETIGEGTYGIVYKCRELKTGKYFALKKFHIEPEDETEGIPPTTIREISILKELNHPNIIKVEDVFIKNDVLYIAYEFISMDLHKYLKQIGHLGEKTVKIFLFQIIHGLFYCHQRSILHRDLKPENLLVDDVKKIIKLADFGFSRKVGFLNRLLSQEFGTLWYQSPEKLLGLENYTSAVDIWSIGCVFAEMSINRPIFCGDSQVDQLFKIFETWPGVSKLSHFQANFPDWKKCKLNDMVKNFLCDNGINLLKKMLIYNPDVRISAKQVLLHKYFDDLDFSMVPISNRNGSILF